MASDPLASLVADARRRANRRVLFEAIALGLLPALGVVLIVRVVALVAGASIGRWLDGAALLAGLIAAGALYIRRHLDDREAALLLDRRAGTRERCVTGIRVGGRVARDALSHVDPDTIRLVLVFRPPPAALATLLAAGALAALHLLPGVGPAPVVKDLGGVETVLRGSGGGGGSGTESGDGAAPADPEAAKSRILRLVRQAEAPLEDGAAAEALRAAGEAIEKGDLEGARARLEAALAKVAAEDGGSAGDVSRIERAFDAAGGAATARDVADRRGRVVWGEDANLVRRYLRLIDETRR